MWNPIRPYLGIAAAAALIGFAFYFQYIRDKAQKFDAVTAQLAQERGQFAAWKVQQRKRDDASTGYQNELAQLRGALASKPAPVIRVCAPATGNPQAPAASASTVVAGLAAGTAATGSIPAGAGLSEPAGADIGPAVRDLLTRSEQLSAQLRAILHQGE